MSNLPTFTEIFKEVEAQKTKKEKIAQLQKSYNLMLAEFLNFTFHPKIKWLLPEGEPPYDKPAEDPEVLRQRIYQEMRRLQHFTNAGPYPNMDKRKREKIFIDTLKTIHQDDAKLICYIKDKRALPFKSVTKALVEEAFPQLADKWKVDG